MLELRRRHDGLETWNPSGSGDHYRSLSRLSGLLVRPSQGLATLARFYAEIDEVHRRAFILGEAASCAGIALPAMRRNTDSRARHRPQRPFHLLAMPRRAWTLHRFLRIPEGEEFHPSTLTAGDPATPGERPLRELLKLWRRSILRRT